ncbi:MAG: Rieske [2Fe-2S] protein [Paenibacillus sp.]|jgi:3-phenylpropionate/trans-cinnamate dioxygenase ferredoxin subunit|uniref:Rieske (2Fe-2S) protein n=1 Tax=Paenibacillus sp. GCM10012303 TaxID=3317340 RepID=UPI0029F2FAFA|nr:Rieske [2Fe-2S] protein [Paenibacillus sp.]
MSSYLAGRVSEIPPGTRKIVEVNRRSIGIYNIDGRFYAIRNLCPHQGAPLCEGITSAYVTSPRPGEFVYEREGEVVRCPWHFWEFDIKSGCMIVDPATRTKTYDVTVERYDVCVEDGNVIVHMA